MRHELLTQRALYWSQCKKGTLSQHFVTPACRTSSELHTRGVGSSVKVGDIFKLDFQARILMTVM